MGWSATYETYLAFLSKFPLVDKDWELQLLPITAVRDAGPAAGLVPPPAPATTVAALSMPATTRYYSFSIHRQITCLFFFIVHPCAAIAVLVVYHKCLLVTTSTVITL
jgi:hypothetical protein